MKFAYSNAKDANEADVVMFGVPDSHGSHANTKGSRFGPYYIRKVSKQRTVFKRHGEKFFVQPEDKLLYKKLYDMGDIKKSKVRKTTEAIALKAKVPLCIGGDHSITTEVVNGLMPFYKDISIIYFDAHPDLIKSKKPYYGSVVSDILRLNTKKEIVQVGIRAPEKEEIKTAKDKDIKTITANDVQKFGCDRVLAWIRRSVHNNVYISIDMDVLDPAFAPGVDCPTPGGLSTKELIYMLRQLYKLNVIGLDIMEVSPQNDINDMTSDIATKLIIEFL